MLTLLEILLFNQPNNMFLLTFVCILGLANGFSSVCDELASRCLFTIDHGRCLRNELFKLPPACLDHVAYCNDPKFLELPIIKRVSTGVTYRLRKVENPLSSSFSGLDFARALYYTARAEFDMRNELRKVADKLCCPRRNGVQVCYPNKGPNVFKHSDLFPCPMEV